MQAKIRHDIDIQITPAYDRDGDLAGVHVGIEDANGNMQWDFVVIPHNIDAAQKMIESEKIEEN